MVGVVLALSAYHWLHATPWASPSHSASRSASSWTVQEEAAPADPALPLDDDALIDEEPIQAPSSPVVEPPTELSFPFSRAMASEPAVTPELVGMQSYLLVGLDRRNDRGWGRADTLLVALFDPETEHAAIVSLPRDLYVEIPGYGMERINATLTIAERQHQDAPQVLASLVGNILGSRIEHTLAIDLRAFERSIDALGGVVVEVPCPIRDLFHDERQPSGNRLLDVPAGDISMDGATAAMYVRSRHGRSDWSRARRQQAVLLAMRRRIGQPGGLRRLFEILDVLDGSLQTDLSRLELIGLVRRLHALRVERLHGLVLGHRFVRAHRSPRGGSVLLPDEAAIRGAMKTLFEAPSPGAMPAGARCKPAGAAFRRTDSGAFAD